MQQRCWYPHQLWVGRHQRALKLCVNYENSLKTPVKYDVLFSRAKSIVIHCIYFIHTYDRAEHSLLALWITCSIVCSSGGRALHYYAAMIVLIYIIVQFKNNYLKNLKGPPPLSGGYNGVTGRFVFLIILILCCHNPVDFKTNTLPPTYKHENKRKQAYIKIQKGRGATLCLFINKSE